MDGQSLSGTGNGVLECIDSGPHIDCPDIVYIFDENYAHGEACGTEPKFHTFADLWAKNVAS